MKTRALRLAGFLSLVLFSLPAAAQQAVEGPKVTTKAAEVQVGGRVQTQFNTTSVDEEPTTDWRMRRVRLEAKVKVNDVVSGKIQPEFAGSRISLKDAYLLLTFSPGVQVLAGKAHRPFSLLEQTSSTRILPVERGAAIRGVTALDQYNLVNGLDYSDRDVGLQVMGAPEGAPLGLAYAAGVFEGPLGAGVGPEDSYQLAARATVRPLERVQLGAGWSSRDFAVLRTGFDPELERGNAFEVDFEYGSFSPGLHVMGEVSWGDFDPFTGRDFFGAQSWVGYRTGRISEAVASLEPVFRASYGAVEDGAIVEDLGGVLLTPGVTVWLGGLNRVMLNYDVWLPREEGAETASSFKAMFQLAF